MVLSFIKVSMEDCKSTDSSRQRSRTADEVAGMAEAADDRVARNRIRRAAVNAVSEWRTSQTKIKKI